MKSFVIGFLLLSNFAFAQTASVQVKGFNFNYDDPKGSGSASTFTLSGVNSLEGVQVAVEKVEDVFQISVSGSHEEQMAFKDAPAFIKDAQHMDIENFNLDLSSKATISMTEGNFNSPKSDLMMKAFSLDCNRDLDQKEVMDQVISGCTNKMTVRAADFSSSSKEVHSAFAKVSESLQTVVTKSRGGARIKSLKFNVAAGEYDLAADVKADISGKVSSFGKISYDASKGLLTLKISNVKFSILSVTSKVFDELKKNESEKFKVKQPYVYITVK